MLSLMEKAWKKEKKEKGTTNFGNLIWKMDSRSGCWRRRRQERNEAAVALNELLGGVEIGLEGLIEESAASSSVQVICIS